MAGAAFTRCSPPCRADFLYLLWPIRVALRDGLSTVHRRSAGHFARHTPMESWLVFFQTVARGDQFFSSIRSFGSLPGGPAKLPWSLPRSTAVGQRRLLLCFAGSAPSLALYIQPAMDVRPTLFVALGWSRAPRVCRCRLLGGLYSFPTFLLRSRAHNSARPGVYPRAVPSGHASHLATSCGRCSHSFKVERGRAWLLRRALCVQAIH